MKIYVREGWWCECEQSWNVNKGVFEGGVSVYDCEGTNGVWKPQGYAWDDKNGKNRVRSPDAIWLLVEGAPCDTQGGDREPLLKNVSVLKRLLWKPAAAGFVDAGDLGELPTFAHSTHPRELAGPALYKTIEAERYGDDEDEDDHEGDEDDDGHEEDGDKEEDDDETTDGTH